MLKDILKSFNKSNNVIDYRVEDIECLDNDTSKNALGVSDITNHFQYIIVNKYLKILGNDKKFGINWANNIYRTNYNSDSLLVAYDIFGGLFIIKDYQVSDGKIWYFAPDTMTWENLEVTYKDFIKWVCTEDFSLFYLDFPIKYIKDNPVQMEEDSVLLIYPYLWSEEYKSGTPTINVISFRELFELNQDIYRQLN